MNESLPFGEKMTPKWQPIEAGSRPDGESLWKLHSEFNGLPEDHTSVREEDLQRYSEKEGLILRKGGEAVGYVTFRIWPNAWIGETEQAPLLYVKELYVRESSRTAAVTISFIKALREVAQLNGSKYLGWTTGSDIMVDLSRRMGLDARDMGEMWIVPIGQLDIGKLAGRI